MLSDFNRDKVTLVKADGTITKEQIPALVTGEMIFTTDKTLRVEVGDYLLHSLPNGLVERYEVTNPNHFGVGHGLDAHFQIGVSPAGSPQAQATVVQGITNNFNGPDSRVNINSTDNSIIVSTDFASKQLYDFVEQVRPVLSQLPEDSQQIIEAQLVIIEEEADKLTPTKMRVLAALQSIKSVAERKLKQQWVPESHIAVCSNFLNSQFEHMDFGICHGTRRGMEQAWFRKHLNSEVNVIGTEISDTADQFENTVQWDFHEQNPDWIGKADFVYSNSWDHAFDPIKAFCNWVDTLKPGGFLLLDYTSGHSQRLASQLDPFGIRYRSLIELLKTELSGRARNFRSLDLRKENPEYPALLVRFQRI